METKKFDYSLPKELIAQTPLEPRDSSRLLVLERKKRRIGNDAFRNVINYLSPGDVLVLNDTRVIPARLPARRVSGGKAEIFLLKKLRGARWEALVKPGAKLPPGAEVIIREGINVKILEESDDGHRIIEFLPPGTGELALKEFGQIPLPPYIKKPISDPDRYQTIYAEKNGSVAAPTAALHFTSTLLKQIEDKGIVILYLTLHMGLGSFQPIREETVEDHKMPPEYYCIPEITAKRVNQAKKSGKKIIPCGTDVVRALEASTKNERLQSGCGNTSLFITNNYKFKIVDTLITNLHLPRSSHLVLVSAFAGRDFVLKAYQYAVNKKFRFYTFGDATIVI
ncbi:tRNA preQ1(34) S-adenosylmethionine ribosyltransferase-isomerase QueA [candidate division NPL-UPA2 bacterium Unc8]|uniref:S-adenosylmethionine:tRNA ribosyltransferase-isomerase n=1 Tax=candidate division NPL-UPA2 bacterium Unc8 TaxID=1980939 RepID=A0A399FZJ5_UNCN2|nr:S-adenosylmethionine:tRNA ribosyltransferase-isomerase [Bacillota bacterium]MBT9146597.1 S-adenosylmethionine:tRNA ribosyltransferase-isomerase [Bacillota bacterium]RII00780.1 MAG: tRNA preQ1(34) S-adenosylmethionine ribosyltransferase-isomerase QueA [candidate division NPL-UPA2 bacterium Unc8]